MELRITKYNPKCRRSDGTYDRDEWTSYSDIGKQFSDGILTRESYLFVEEKFISTIVSFFRTAGISCLSVEDSENFEGVAAYLKSSDKINFAQLDQVGPATVESIIRLCLREQAWCKLRGERDAYLHFGYDYYVYVGADSGELVNWRPLDGIFAEPFQSPYKD